ncbi:MAG: hypothetical protein SFX74_00440 [Fimbriimonadaceae bacterium]|nr:hypothetical protein [Fimbriimonadaceae bacterium]
MRIHVSVNADNAREFVVTDQVNFMLGFFAILTEESLNDFAFPLSGRLKVEGAELLLWREENGFILGNVSSSSSGDMELYRVSEHLLRTVHETLLADIHSIIVNKRAHELLPYTRSRTARDNGHLSRATGFLVSNLVFLPGFEKLPRYVLTRSERSPEQEDCLECRWSVEQLASLRSHLITLSGLKTILDPSDPSETRDFFTRFCRFVLVQPHAGGLVLYQYCKSLPGVKDVYEVNMFPRLVAGNGKVAVIRVARVATLQSLELAVGDFKP